MSPILVGSFAELWSKIGNGTKFTIEDMENMMAVKDNEGKTFTVIHRDKIFELPHSAIVEYFKSHAKPEKQMSASEENEKLKKLLDEATRELEILKGRASTSETVPEFEHEALPTPMAPPSPLDPRDKPESIEEMQERLKRELLNTVPKVRNTK